MRRILSTSLVFLLGFSTLSLGTLVGAQVAGGVAGGIPQGQPRDPGALQVAERRIPVGTSAISGTVVNAETGRPVAGARVTVTLQVKPAAAATVTPATPQPAARGATAGAAPASGPTRGGAPQMIVSQLVSRTVMTDANGAFAFPRLPAGQFTVSVYQSQYLSMNYGQTRYGGQGKSVALADGQQATLKVALLRGGVITGMVIGPDGDPIRSALIRAWRVDISSGFRRLQQVGGGQTDDRGMYRLFGLTPGEYFVSAQPSPAELLNGLIPSQADLIERAIASGPVNPPAAPGMPPTVSVSITPPAPPGLPGSLGDTPSPSYLPTYSPSSMLPSGGTSVIVAAAEEKNGVDVRVQLTQASTIRGTITTPVDPAVTLQLWLVSDDASIDSAQTMSARADMNGSFLFRSVGPGNYTVVAQTMPTQPPINIINGQAQPPPQPPPALTDAQKMWGRTRVTVAGEPTVPVSVALKPGLTISGVVAFEMAKPPDLSRSRPTVGLVQAPSPQSMFFGALPQTQTEPDGRFTITGVMPGRYTMRFSGGLLKSAVVAGQDILDFPLDFTGDRNITDAVLTVTDQSSELSGSLLDSAGKPAEGYTIICVATDNRFWRPGSRRIVMARTAADGLYTIRGLPPGAYQLAAVLDLEQGAQYDPEFLRSLAQASVPITIAAGGKVTQDLRVK